MGGLSWLSGAEFVSADKDKRVLGWKLSEAEPAPRVLYPSNRGVAGGHITRVHVGHTAPVQALVFVDDGKRLISAGNDARVMVLAINSTYEEGS